MLLLVGSVGIISGYAHPFTGEDGKTTNSQMGSIGDATSVRPRALRRSPSFQIYYDPGLNAVLVSSTSDVGLVHAVIENLSTGSLGMSFIDTSAPVLLPIGNERGRLRVTIIIEEGIQLCYECDNY